MHTISGKNVAHVVYFQAV